jgi:MFS family permease
MGAGYGLVAVSPVVALAAVGCLVGGVGNGIYYVSVVQAIQERVGEGFQARVMSLLESVTAAGCGVGFILGGTLTALADARVAFAVAAAGVLVSAAAIRLVLRDRAAEPAVAAPAVEPVAAGAPRPPARRRPRTVVRRGCRAKSHCVNSGAEQDQ